MFNDNPSFSIMDKKFNVIVLAAGIGSRLRPETDYVPKALVQLGKFRAIDHFIRKYQHIADKFIIAVGHGADLLENYVTGKYPTVRMMFSRENVSDLRGPGTSLVYALDYASSRLPTIVSFCDYVVGDYVPVDNDILGVCRFNKSSVLGEYTSLAVAEEGIVTDIVKNANPLKVKDMGFTGFTVCHNTLFLKMLAYQAAVSKKHVDFTFDIIRKYITKIKTRAFPILEILEFGTADTLEKTRRILGGSDTVHS